MLVPLRTTKFPNIVDAILGFAWVPYGMDALSVASCASIGSTRAFSVRCFQSSGINQNMYFYCVLRNSVAGNRRLTASGSVGNYALNHYCRFPKTFNKINNAPPYPCIPDFPILYLGLVTSAQIARSRWKAFWLVNLNILNHWKGFRAFVNIVTTFYLLSCVLNLHNDKTCCYSFATCWILKFCL